jgi:acetate---CoA ligase (ADP-forming)
MINEQLLNPKSIVVIGGSNDVHKPGGAVLRNLIEGVFRGALYVTNLKEPEVQGIKSYRDAADLPDVDLAIIAIAAKFIPDTVEVLAKQKNTRAFIILSAGFSEESREGKILEQKVVDIVNSVHGVLIGPNCIGVITPGYEGVFTKPIPKHDPRGCDFISGSGATACFIMEAGIPRGITFASVYSVGNSAQMGVEEVLKYMDENFDPEKSSRVKLLYIENVSKPGLLLKHSASLIRKGCRIAAVKAGTSAAGSRAASSHTGALASPDIAVDALFRKAGIVRCYGREDMISVASVFMNKEMKGNNMAIITHAGGPAVMLTDTLSNGGINVPVIDGPASQELLAQLFPGASVANPIDILATGNAEQLGLIIDYIENKFDRIDGMTVIFGSPGLQDVYEPYRVLHQKMKETKKPIFPVLPSILTAREETIDFISKDHVYFPDEVVFGNALCRVFKTLPPLDDSPELPGVDIKKIRSVIDRAKDGYLSPPEIQILLDACGIPRVKETIIKTREELVSVTDQLSYPLVMKVIGPIHKSDVGGVVLNVSTKEKALQEFDRMIKIKDTTSVLIQPMHSGMELFLGAKMEEKFGHMILCGLGGIFIEVMKDIAAGLAPIGREEARLMIQSLKGYKMIQGTRGQQGVNEEKFGEIIMRLSALLKAAPEIMELDFNPLLGIGDDIVVVDSRINIRKL